MNQLSQFKKLFKTDSTTYFKEEYKEIHLNEFLPTLKSVIELHPIKHIIFIDHNPHFTLKRLAWIFDRYACARDFVIFSTMNNLAQMKTLLNFDCFYNVRCRSDSKQAASHCITAQINQAQIYLSMLEYNIDYTIITTDLFAFDIQAEFTSQNCHVINPSSTRVDLFLISIIDYSQLLPAAQHLKHLLEDKSDDLLQCIDIIDGTHEANIINEIPYYTDITKIPDYAMSDLIDIRKYINRSHSLQQLKKYLSALTYDTI